MPLVAPDPRSYNSATNDYGFPLGSFYTDPRDGRTWRFIRNGNAAGDANITIGQVVEWASATDYIVSSTRAAGSSLGRIPAGIHDGTGLITKNFYGFILVKGFISDVGSAFCAAGSGAGAPGVLLTSSAVAGECADVVNAYDHPWGFGLAAETAASGVCGALAAMRGGWTVPTPIGAVVPSSYNSSTNAEGYVLGEHYSYYGADGPPTGIYRFFQNANGAGDTAIRNGDVCELASTTAFVVSASRAAGSSLGRVPMGVGVGTIDKGKYGFLLVCGRHTSIPSTTGTINVQREQKTHTVTGEGTNVTAAFDVPWGTALTAVSGAVYTADVCL